MDFAWAVCAAMLFMCYKAFNLSDTGVYKSITMDFTPNQHRGKLNVIQSIIEGCKNLFTMLGGLLAEHLGIFNLFIIVAILNFLTLTPLIYI